MTQNFMLKYFVN